MTLLDYLPSLHHAAATRIDPAIWPLTAGVDDLGRLCVGDVPLTDIADEFRTPAYVLDETDFRQRLTQYRTTLRNTETVYAAKALLTTTVARWVAEEGAGIDVSSGGELATALAGGVDPAPAGGALVAALVGHVHLRPDHRRDALGTARGVELEDPVHVPVIGDRDSLLSDRIHAGDQFFDVAGAVQQRVVRVQMQVGELSHLFSF